MILLAFLIASYVECEKLRFNLAKETDRILSLPGLDIADYSELEMFSGYLNISETKRIHYYFVQAEDPSKKPWTLWLNGGPGCSSMQGLLTENGPFNLNESGELIKNNYGWHKVTSMLYFESPIGVGFSFSLDDLEYDHVGDGSVAADNKMALDLFLERFPEYKKRDLYISGESYAGKYVPRLISLLSHSDPYNAILKGAAIGNGYFNERFDYNSRLFYANYHGLVGPMQWNELISSCCQNCTEKCDFYDVKNNDICALHSEDIISQLWMDGLNIYNIYQECDGGSSMNHFKNFLVRDFPDNVQARIKQLAGNKKVTLTPYCTNDKPIEQFMNDPEVRNAMHVVSNDTIGRWNLCSDTIFNKYHKQTRPMDYFLNWFWRNIPKGRILLYAGDIDMACNFIGVQEFAQSLGRTVTKEYTNWLYKEGDYNQQIGGFIRRWEGLTFATVRGAGHMVPTDRPRSSFHLFKLFIEDQW